MSGPQRILLVDDHLMFREGIRSRLDRESDFVVVGEAASAEEALSLTEEQNPSIVILDIRLPVTSGIELARLLRDGWPELKLLVLSGYDFDQYVTALARIGIDGYLLKDAPQEELVRALREIANGGAVLPPDIASKVMKSYALEPARSRTRQPWDLTLREIEILELLHQGLRNADIARQIAISPRTVEAHVSRVIAKLGAQSRTEAVRFALERGLIK
jgi:DNA-binding NarL/FixJ family response regulator